MSKHRTLRIAAALLAGSFAAREAAAQSPIIAQTVDLGGSCGAGFPTLNSTRPILTGDLTMFVTTAYPNAPITLFVQPPLAAPIDIGSGCTAFVDGLNAAVFQGVTDAQGAFTVTIPTLYLVPFEPGIRCDAQALIEANGPGTVNVLGVQAIVTNAIALIMGFEPELPPSDVPPSNCIPCTKTRSQWRSCANWSLVTNNWSTVFGANFFVGVFNPGNGTCPPNGKKFTNTSTGRYALNCYLDGSGTPGVFCNDTTNSANSSGAGSLGRNLAALQLNIAFGDAGFLGCPGFGDLVFIKPGDPLNGFTVRQIFQIFTNAAAGLGLPGWYCPPDVNAFLVNLNCAYVDCTPSTWANTFLFRKSPADTSL
jgi:hypothetical protein